MKYRRLEMWKRILVLIFIIASTIYSPIELTRVIRISWEYYHNGFFSLTLETLFIWITYFLGMTLVGLIIWRKTT